MLDFPFKNFCKLTQHAETIGKNVWEKSDDGYSLIRVKNMINHISICFVLQHQRQRKCFFRAQHIDVSSMVWTLPINGKSTNQRFASIVAKI